MKYLIKKRDVLFLSGLWIALFLTASLLVPSPIPAVEKAENVQPQTKVHITSERMVSNTRDRYAEFSGNVDAVQGDTSIKADSLKIYYKEDADPASGTGNQEDVISRIVATGNVKIQVEGRLAIGEKAVYTAEDGLLVLTGDKARIESEGNYINGEEIVLNRRTGQISINGGKGERVEAVFESENSRSERPNGGSASGGGKSQENAAP